MIFSEVGNYYKGRKEYFGLIFLAWRWTKKGKYNGLFLAFAHLALNIGLHIGAVTIAGKLTSGKFGIGILPLSLPLPGIAVILLIIRLVSNLISKRVNTNNHELNE